MIFKIVAGCLVLLSITAVNSCGTRSYPNRVAAETREDSGFANPLLGSGPDPYVIRRNGQYYYTHTFGNRIVIFKTAAMSQRFFCAIALDGFSVTST